MPLYFSSRRFDKQFSKFSEKIKNKCLERIQIFVQNPYEGILNNHVLGGKYKNCRSINMTGDIRIIYEMTENNLAHFLEIGTHGELYK